MLNKLLSYIYRDLVTTTILVGIASCIWIGYRAYIRKIKQYDDKYLYDILIDIMTIPILTFAVIGFCLSFKHDSTKKTVLEL